MSFLHNLARTARDNVARMAGALPGTSLQFGPPRRAAPTTAIIDRDALIRHVIQPARIAHRPVPEMADPPLDKWMSAPGTADIKEIFVAELPRGRYWGKYHGYLIDRNDTLLTDLSFTFRPPGQRHDALCHLKLPPVREVRGTVAVINTLYADNFHHFMLDVAPRFEWLRRAGWKWSQIDHFVWPGSHTRYHRETLQLLGIPEEKLIHSGPQVHLRAERLLVPGHSEPGDLPLEYGYTPEGLQFVRNFVLTDNPFLANTYPRRIIISREKAPARRLVQAERAHELLAPLGFEKVLLENHSISEQAAMFHEADCIIMPTGGNLANLAFCRAGTIAIELFSPNYYPPFTYSILGEIPLRYYGLVADKISRPFPGARKGDEDIDFDPERLAQIARAALEKFDAANRAVRP